MVLRRVVSCRGAKIEIDSNLVMQKRGMARLGTAIYCEPSLRFLVQEAKIHYELPGTYILPHEKDFPYCPSVIEN